MGTAHATYLTPENLEGIISGRGLITDGTNIGLTNLCATNQVLQWNGSEWLCQNIFSGSYNDLSDIPANIDTDATDDFSGDYTDLTNQPSIAYTTNEVPWTDLTGVPTNLDTDSSDDFDGTWSSLTEVPINIDIDSTDDFDGDYASLTNAPSLNALSTATLTCTTNQVTKWNGSAWICANDIDTQFSGNWGDLSGIPANLDTDTTDDFSGDYADLTNKPSIAYATAAVPWEDLTNVPANLDTDSSDDSPWNKNSTTIYYTDGLVGLGTSTVNDQLDIAGDMDLTGTIKMDGLDLITRRDDPWSIYIGQYAGSAISGINKRNTAIGYESMKSTTGSQNTAIGWNTLKANSTGGLNIAIGDNTMLSNTSGSRNTAVGTSALQGSKIGVDNTALGYQSHYASNSGQYNTSAGAYSLYSNSAGHRNAAFGANALRNNTGNYNTGVGFEAGNGNNTGAENVFIGYQTGRGATGAFSQNTILGSQAGYSLGASSNGNVFVGYKAGYSETGANKLYIENSNATSPLIYGEFDNDIVTINGNLGIGDSNPQFPLSVRKDTNGLSGALLINADTGTEAITALGLLNDAFDADGESLVMSIDGKNVSDPITTVSSTLDLEINSDGAIGFYTFDDTPITFSPNDSEALRITGDGKVGIGTDAPVSKLHLKSTVAWASPTIRIDGNTTSNPVSIMLNRLSSNRWSGIDFATNSTSNWYIGTTYNSGIAENGLSIGTNYETSNAKFYIDTTGNIGIGTTEPKTKLDVNGIIKTAPRASATCSSDTEGGIYYDSDDNHFYGCNGTAWVQLDN